MKTNYLLPHHFRLIGWCIYVPMAILGILWLITGSMDISGSGNFLLRFIANSWMDELIVIALTVSGVFIAFSKEKDEDECIASIRLQSLVMAIIADAILLVIGTLLIYNLDYLTFLFVYIFSMYLLFFVIYYCKIRKFRRTNEE